MRICNLWGGCDLKVGKAFRKDGGGEGRDLGGEAVAVGGGEIWQERWWWWTANIL